MMGLDELLKRAGGALKGLGEGPPDMAPEALAELHDAQGDDAPFAELRALFHGEEAPGEASWQPSSAAVAALAAHLDPSPLRRGLHIVLELVGETLSVLRHTGELLTAQPLAVRGAPAAEATPTRHTFHQRMASWDAAVGLEPEGDGRFCVTLTLEGDREPAVRVTLWEGARRRAVQSGTSAVHLEGLGRGRYRLEVSADGLAVGDIDLEVSGGDDGD